MGLFDLYNDTPRKRNVNMSVKRWAWEHSPHSCNICHKRIKDFFDAEFDHTRAYSKGGASNLSNVKMTHKLCNRIKGKKTLSETRKILGMKNRPKAKSGQWVKKVKVGETMLGEPIYKIFTLNSNEDVKKVKIGETILGVPQYKFVKIKKR
jgi:hypothetical protein